MAEANLHQMTQYSRVFSTSVWDLSVCVLVINKRTPELEAEAVSASRGVEFVSISLTVCGLSMYRNVL